MGKTTLAKALAASIDATVRRIQFTPDLLPSDVTGVTIYDQETRAFEFNPGRSSPTSWWPTRSTGPRPRPSPPSSRCMEERRVTVDGFSYELAQPFLAMATQNPIEMEGTYPLPRLAGPVHPPGSRWATPTGGRAGDARAGGRRSAGPGSTGHRRATGAPARLRMALHVSEAVRRYVVLLVEASRRNSDLRRALPSGPGCGCCAPRAPALALTGRDHVLPDDVQALAAPVLAHPCCSSAGGGSSRTTAEQVVAGLVASVPVPRR